MHTHTHTWQQPAYMWTCVIQIPFNYLLSILNNPSLYHDAQWETCYHVLRECWDGKKMWSFVSRGFSLNNWMGNWTDESTWNNGSSRDTEVSVIRPQHLVPGHPGLTCSSCSSLQGAISCVYFIGHQSHSIGTHSNVTSSWLIMYAMTFSKWDHILRPWS